MRLITSGDSHGQGLFGIIEGFPAHFRPSAERIDKRLKLRQSVYGRGERMKIESDRVEILSGLWNGETTGAPLTFSIKNRSTTPPNSRSTVPRPGHADLSGMLKYGFDDARVATERASSRRTAMDVAVGEFCRQALEELGVKVFGFTKAVGEIESLEIARTEPLFENHPLLCPDDEAETGMMTAVDSAKRNGYTLGGKVRVISSGVPSGMGTFTSSDGRMTSLMGKAVLGIPSVHGVLFGEISQTVGKNGNESVDEIHEKLVRRTNFSGGIEGGMANGQDIVIELFVKPVPTQRSGVKSVDLENGMETVTGYVRSDTCVVAAVAVIAADMVSTALMSEILMEFGGSTFEELKERIESYRRRIDIG